MTEYPTGPLSQVRMPGAQSAVLGLLSAALILAVAIQGDHWGWAIILELALCGAAGVTGFFPVVGATAAGALLPTLIPLDGTSGLAPFAALIPILITGMTGWLRTRLAYTLWYMAVMIVWTAQTLRKDESLTLYSVFWLVLVTTVWLAGDAVRHLVKTQERLRTAQLAEQRRGIARDLHDTVAHALSLIVMRTEQARLHGNTTEEDLVFISQTANRSIKDLRGMMSLLRRSDEPNDQHGSVWRVEPLSQVLDGVSAELQRNGFTPSVSVDGDLNELPAAVNEALAKVAHEATSNIVRHGAPGTRCAVLVEVSNDDAEIVITSVPRVAGKQRRREHPLGLTGMRERVEALGGEFTAGQGAQRWITRARLPLTR